ncbi:arylsulfatase A-like enzyme [Actinocorallia herbida]|uniref:Arylsulfatase A-like enzyme n=1 Tax=Actinocorallia herbida TaxID=58109 RepID=A0A3N1D0Z0_9ACTN|nr:sulfatase-like hydrolase/transferase [Actinocorallia herbida]ROO87197.1 arylsulfatase A-like enzyme [Actinocorallia herbida]
MTIYDGPSRRGVLAAGAGGLLAAGLPTGTAAQAAPTGRPNILWLVSEDNNPYIGAYGDKLARTPAIDALAREGVRYENSFSSAPVCAPTRFSIITGMHAESCGPGEHMRAGGNIPNFLRGFPEYLREAGYYCTNNSKTDYNAPIDLARTWDASSGSAHWRNRPTDAPFFAVFNFMTTHESAIFNAPAGTTDPAAVRLPAYLPDLPELRADRARYYDLMEKMDAQVAARLTELETAGLAEDTIVFYYSDNGGVLPRSKRYCYDSGLRTGLIVRYPKKWAHLAPARAGSVVTAPVSSIDLPPTVLTLAGLPVPRHLHGTTLTSRRRPEYAFGMRNRMDERYDMVRTVRDERYRYIRNYAPHRIVGQHQAYAWQQRGYQVWEQAHLDGALTEVQERFWRAKPAEELYDLHADPDEVRNLAAEPRHRARLRRLAKALDEHIERVNDNGFIPEGSPLEGYDASRAPGAYPLRKVRAVADLAISRKRGNLRRFTELLDDGNEAIRYWAATGLLVLAAEARPARRALDERLRAETSPQVRVVLAEALANAGDPDTAVASLTETLATHPDPRVRLQAVNALTYLGDAAEPALPAVRTAAESPDEYLSRSSRYLAHLLSGTYTPTLNLYTGPGTA